MISSYGILFIRACCSSFNWWTPNLWKNKLYNYVSPRYNTKANASCSTFPPVLQEAAGISPAPANSLGRGLYRVHLRADVGFSEDPKTSRARKPSRKAPETTFGCFSKHPKNFEPEKYVIFPRKLHGYSLPPEKRFRVCFSCTCLIKWRPPTYFLGQNKRPRSCIKRERELRRGERTMS